MSIFFYCRPDYVAKLPGPMSLSQCQTYVEKTQKHRKAISPELSFENVVQNKALPPCALQDFMEYLVYVSHDAENLQFWLWIQDYTKRFNQMTRSEQALSPPWLATDSANACGPSSDQCSRMEDKRKAIVIEYEVNFENTDHTASLHSDKQSFISGMASTSRTVAGSVYDANLKVGLKWQPFTIQPFRSEINRVISHYIAPNAPRELNLSHQHRAAVLHAVQHTTHPSAFSTVKEMVESTLRGQSHPNFIRWSICNGNKARILLIRNSGIGQVIGGLILGILFVLSHKSRWWRFVVVPLFFSGFLMSVAAYKGLCVALHSKHSRHLRPWEQFQDSMSLSSFDNASNDEANLSTDCSHTLSDRSKKGSVSLDPFGTSNSFAHEPWVEKYKKLSILRKLLSRHVWVQEEAIRVLQNRIVIQSYLWSILFTILLTALFVALPEFHVF